MHSVLHAVAPEAARLAPIQFAAQLLALGKEAAAGQPAQALGDAGAFHFDFERFSGLGRQPHPAIAKAVFVPLVAMATDKEPGFPAH